MQAIKLRNPTIRAVNTQPPSFCTATCLLMSIQSMQFMTLIHLLLCRPLCSTSSALESRDHGLEITTLAEVTMGQKRRFRFRCNKWLSPEHNMLRRYIQSMQFWL